MNFDKVCARHYQYLIVILAIAVSISFQGSRGLYETTEGRYAEVSREMIETGNYLEPTLNYQPHWTKPPLTYWAIAGGLAVFGNNAWGARFFNVIAFVGAVWAVYYMGVIVGGRNVGIVAALIYLSSLFPVAGAFAVTTDTLLTMWELFGVMAYLRAYTHYDVQMRRRWTIAMWFFFGMAFFTKGPPALFPLLAIGLWQWLHPGRARVFNAYGIAVFMAAALSWVGWIFWKHPDLLNYYIGHEVVDRLSSHDLHNSDWYKPFTLYLPALLFGSGPWFFIALYQFFKKQYPFVRARVAAFLKTDHPIAFAVYWVLLPLAVFSIVKSRLALYVLPLFAPLVLLAAYAMVHNAADSRRLLRFTARLAIVLVVAWIGAKGVLARYPVDRNMKQVLEDGRAISADAPIAVYENEKLYGMQFYTNGRMKRVSRTGEEPWADCGIDAFLADCREKKLDSPHCLLLVKKDHLPDLRQIILTSGLACREFDNGKWRWLLLSDS